MKFWNLYLRPFYLLVISIIALVGCNSGSSPTSDASTQTTNYSNKSSLADSDPFVKLRTDYGSVGAGSTNNSRSPSIVLYFNKSLNTTTINSTNIALLKGDTKIETSTLFVSANSQAIVFSPIDLLDANTQYTIVVSNAVKANDGSGMDSNYSATFTTGSGVGPTVAMLNPYETNISTLPTMQIVFSESNLKNVNSSNIYLKGYYSDNPQIATILGCDSSKKLCTLTVDTSGKQSALKVNTTYDIVVTQAIKDSSGNNLAAAAYFYFKTGDGKVTYISNTIPANNESGVSIAINPQVQFSAPVNNVKISLHQDTAGGVLISSSIKASADRASYTIIPAANLPMNTSFYMVIESGAVDDSGAIVNGGTYKFTTTNSNAPTVAIEPSGYTDINISDHFDLKFSMGVNSVSTASVKLYKNGTEQESLTLITYSESSYAAIPNNYLEYDTDYTLVLESTISAVSDSSNHLNSQSYNYKTVADTQAPVAIIANLSSNNYLSPRTTRAINIVFTKEVTGVTADDVILYLGDCGSNQIIPTTITTLSAKSYNLNLSSSYYLIGNNSYCISISKNVVDLSSNKNPVANSQLIFNTNYFIFTVESDIRDKNKGNQVESGYLVAATDSSGAVYMAGGVYDATTAKHTYYVAKYDSNQNLIWRNTFDNKSSYYYVINKLVLDEQRGKIYLIGYTDKDKDPDYSAIYVAQYTTSSGASGWTYSNKSPDEDNIHTDYLTLYQGRGGTIDNSGNLYVVGVNRPDLSNVDSFIFQINTSGSVTKYTRIKPDGNNECYANAAVKYDSTYFYITGSTQSQISDDDDDEATSNDDDFEGFIMKIKFSDLSTSGDPFQFGPDHDSKGVVNGRDIAIRVIGSCTYAVVVGDTKYAFNNASGSYIYADGGDPDAFVYYKTISGSCSSVVGEFGVSNGSTIAQSITLTPSNGGMYISGVTTGTLAGFVKTSAKGNTDGFVAAKDNSSSSQTVWTSNEWLQTGASAYKTAPVITSNSTSGALYLTGTKLNTGSYSRYYASMMNPF